MTHPGIMDGIVTGTAADIQDGIIGLNKAIHHPDRNILFVWMALFRRSHSFRGLTL